MATRDQIDALTEEATEIADRVQLDPDLCDHKYVASFIRKLSLALIQEHTAYVNEAYRSVGFKPWMRASRQRK